MAKGISAVIATIMLLMITVALIGVFYVFSSGIVTSGTGAAGGAVTVTTDRMLKTIAVSNVICGANTTTVSPANIVKHTIINFTLQNVGTKDILADELSVYVNDVKSDGTTVILNSALNSGLAANAQQQVGIQTASYSKTGTLKVQGPSNTEQRSLTC